jgi:prepilin-type N-terminal cleavage/methylation domain-containing protein
MRKGFTLIELLVVIVIIGILVAIALPNFIRIKDKAKEAEVKQNLHAIQLALERYSVDSESSLYPLLIMGGDWTDSFVVWQSWVDNQGMDPSDPSFISNDMRSDNWVPAAQDVGDSLVMEAYMPSYPGNPFIKQKTDTLLPQIQHTPVPGYGASYSRIVGGRESNKMWECFGPVWTAPTQTTVGDFYVHHIYDNPKYSRTDVEKEPPGGWNDPSGNKDLVGNFSYWPRGSSENGAGWAWQGAPEPQGYTLAGYGALRTSGQDVYNRNGNYKGRYRTEGCSLACIGATFGDVPCLCGSGNPPSRAQNDGGSDTVPDGVVITLDSGVDKKSARTDGENTQGV